MPCEGIRDSTPARRHAGCGQAAGPWKDRPPGAGGSMSAVRPRIDSEQRVRRVRTGGRIEPNLMGCRIATAGEYYRSIYSTIREDATRRSWTVIQRFCYVSHALVEQNRAGFGLISMLDAPCAETPREYRCRRATIHLNSAASFPGISGGHENSNAAVQRDRLGRVGTNVRSSRISRGLAAARGSVTCFHESPGSPPN